MAECGASGSGSSGDSLDKSITLPPDEIFRNLENAKRFAIDIAGGAPAAGQRAGAAGRTKGGGAGLTHSLTGLVPHGPCSPWGRRCPGSGRRSDYSSRKAPRGPERGMPGLVVRAAVLGGGRRRRRVMSAVSAAGRPGLAAWPVARLRFRVLSSGGEGDEQDGKPMAEWPRKGRAFPRPGQLWPASRTVSAQAPLSGEWTLGAVPRPAAARLDTVLAYYSTVQHKVAKVRSFDHSGKDPLRNLCLLSWGRLLLPLGGPEVSTILGSSLLPRILPPAWLKVGANVQRCQGRVRMAQPSVVPTPMRPPCSAFQDTEGDHEPPYEISVQEEITARLHFIKFENTYIEACLDFIKDHLVNTETKVIQATGGGAYKFKDLIEEKLRLKVDKEDVMTCLIKGCNFVLKNIPHEAFVYQKDADPEFRFQTNHPHIFPYLLVNIGSGVSIVKKFDELLHLASRGQHSNVDMLVRDVYGGAHQTLGLSGNLIASSFGKSATADQEFSKEDVAQSLLHMISNDIGQLACLHARLHSLDRVYFGGFFIRGHPVTMRTITSSINFFSKGFTTEAMLIRRPRVSNWVAEVLGAVWADGSPFQALFLRHEGYLGAIGAFLKGAEQDSDPAGLGDTAGAAQAEVGGAARRPFLTRPAFCFPDPNQYSWGENYAGSSGLMSTSPELGPAQRARRSIPGHTHSPCSQEKPLAPLPVVNPPVARALWLMV
ncbi:hypothetical protein P7K49_015194 [Saguinus oedipus]|uniref:Pantothenate kinase 4 n=1 Tax=Saguinus oedipus TaxID=9490 RepID=A0ABQ9V8K3_SAGOE|nr:hypothetical protein P7K49_015194 [Saguinus oedipus]